MPFIFVYGTLKRGGLNHGHLRGQRFAGCARTRPEFRLYELDGFPGLVPTPEDGRSIQGEIWEVDLPCLARLDEFEGVGAGLYAREPIGLLPPDDSHPVEAYLFLGSVAGRRDLGINYA